MAVYFALEIEKVTDQQKLVEYSQRGVETIKQYGGKLVVIGYRQSDRYPTGEQPLHREEGERKGYRRVFDLFPEVDASGIRANLEEGLLTLRIPKSERVQPRKIAIE